MPNSIQFWGKEAVIQAYEYAGMPAWAIFAQRNILTSFEGATVAEGAQSLDQFFDMLINSHSDGMYQLRMYKDPDGDIVNSTPYNASFNFKLQDLEEGERIGGSSAGLRMIQERLGKIEEQLAGEGDGEPEIPSWQQTIGAILGKPEFQNMILEKVVGLIRSLFPRGAPQPGATVGAVPEDEVISGAELYNNLPPDQREKVDQALAILMYRDPDVGTNLMKIATLLQTNPERYKTFAAML